ncbi:PAS domain-containing sensor histidine kinase [Lacinutrix sp. Bg11-31]|uniref:PAS domain-containing sensor histidine kinase n=1 Tax=Lacinutrix sp. Bg11-31 TaxID=2057808 RepID=UPI000C3187F3|nr:PAS domain-containing sensor histidine kinase [Lacinutrix sp. Bg11-31]AUC81661.1 histidine kinase [Lacinutrix sp. Bg11-31]
MNLNTPKSSLKKFQTALEISKIGVWDFNEKKNKVFFSKSSKAIIGFEDDNTFGDNIDDWNDRVHPDDKKKYKKDFNNHINGKTTFYINKHRVLCKDESYKWILDKGQIINDHIKDGYIHFIGTHTDITEQEKNEVKVHNALTIATKQNNKLKNFAHIVTHNLKQYSGNFESLLEFYDQAETVLEKEELIVHLKDVSTCLNRTIQNLNEIVSVQSKKETDIQKLNISTFIEETLKLLDIIIIESNATINNSINPELFVCYSPAYLESIIQNLLTNAIKYKHPERDPIITFSTELTKDKLILSIKDNGLGIDLNKYGKDIFGLYRTFHHNEDAEGVGLYLTKNQVEAFGGEITIESEVNIGTKFNIIIPNKKPN